MSYIGWENNTWAVLVLIQQPRLLDTQLSAETGVKIRQVFSLFYKGKGEGFNHQISTNLETKCTIYL